MYVDSEMTIDGNSDFYKPSLRCTIEANIPYLLTRPNTRTVSVDPQSTIVYNQDLFGYLLTISVLPCYHWVVMRMNGMFSPLEFDSSVTALTIPSTTDLESMRQAWNATTVIKT